MSKPALVYDEEMSFSVTPDFLNYFGSSSSRNEVYSKLPQNSGIGGF
ncbi:MAG: hypothetical protein P8L78_08375 [Mariniblastus sp.]|nr:hypothetical protein [Mariniblastus sp.]